MVNIGPKAFIHLDRIKSNFENIQKVVGDRIILSVVKANGYGHGAIEIAKVISHYNNSKFAVFSFSEAMQLRNSNISNDIIIFSKMQPQFIDQAFKHNIILNLSSIEDIKILKNYKSETNNCPRYHIKFDTGMTRLGIDIKDSELLYRKIISDLGIHPEGIYTHFATADEGDLSYAHMQLEKFKVVVELAEKYNIQFKYVHSSNSGAVLNIRESYFNMIRVGMLLYGALPSNEVPNYIDIKPVMSFCGSIVNLRRVPKGTHVSYGAIYTTKKNTNIGVIQTGFADGFPRPWYELGFVNYNGREYKIAGRVCMDQLMVDFGNTIPGLGDDVLFFGENQMGKIPVEVIANQIDSTPYILLTAIGGRTKHIYID